MRKMRTILAMLSLVAAAWASDNSGLRARVELASGMTGMTGMTGMMDATTPIATVTLSCTPPTTGSKPTSYKFYRGTVSGGPYTLLGSGIGATCAYSDTAVTFGSTYFYVATSVNANPPCPTGKTCESGFSNQTSAVIPSDPTPLPPTGLTNGVIVAHQVPLRWHAPPEAVAEYRLYRRPLGHPTFLQIAQGIATTSFTDKSLRIAGTYDYQVRALAIGKGGSTTLTPPSNTIEIIVAK